LLGGHQELQVFVDVALASQIGELIDDGSYNKTQNEPNTERNVCKVEEGIFITEAALRSNVNSHSVDRV
jgi:hypothetical protein